MVIGKEQIIAEIRRTTEANNGVPLGRNRFQNETGIRYSDWYGKHWRSWGEAIVAAGYKPNELQSAFPENHLFEKLIELIREIGKFPVDAEMRMKAHRDSAFPNAKTFARLGGKRERASKLLDFCRPSADYADVVAICSPIAASKESKQSDMADDSPEMGFVYLIKCGKYFKIGCTNSTGRRTYELSVQLPECAVLVHEIKTDDPHGIEGYWHRRFDEKRKNGEWFDLSSSDISAFKRRRFQ